MDNEAVGEGSKRVLGLTVGSQLGPAGAGEAAACDSPRPPEVVPGEVEPHRPQVQRDLVHGPLDAMRECQGDEDDNGRFGARVMLICVF